MFYYRQRFKIAEGLSRVVKFKSKNNAISSIAKILAISEQSRRTKFPLLSKENIVLLIHFLEATKRKSRKEVQKCTSFA